jgi:hypothetical protein
MTSDDLNDDGNWRGGFYELCDPARTAWTTAPPPRDGETVPPDGKRFRFDREERPWRSN